MRHTSISVYPNNEVRVNNTQERPVRRQESVCERFSPDLADCPPTPPCPLVKSRNGLIVRVGKIENGASDRVGWGVVARDRVFSRYGKRQLLRAGGAMEQQCGKTGGLFITLTIPGSTDGAIRAIAAYSSFLVHGLKAWVNKRVPKKLDFYVWEYQKRGALHLHYVVAVAPGRAADEIASGLKDEWIRLLRSVSRRSGVDVWGRAGGGTWKDRESVVRVDCQRSEKNISAYLAKYLSKGAETATGKRARRYPPARWYGVSRPLLALLRELTTAIVLTCERNRESEARYQDYLHVLEETCSNVHQYRHQVGSGKSIVGFTDPALLKSLTKTLLNIAKGVQEKHMTTQRSMNEIMKSGLILMRKEKTWSGTYNSFGGVYIFSLESKILKGEPVSALDKEMVLDALLYSFRYMQSTRYELEGKYRLWYDQAQQAFQSAIAERRAQDVVRQSVKNYYNV